MRIQLAPGVPDLASLGAGGDASFFVGDPTPPLGRAERVSCEDGLEILRYPLPGTPDRSGRLSGRPSALGTGFVVLRRFTKAPMARSWHARFTAPRSLSFAEREWNLYCHLRRHGVSTPEPLAVGSDGGALFGRRSFLVMRELDEMHSLAHWSKADLDPRQRAIIARAVGLALHRVFRCGVLLPNLGAHSIRVGELRTQAREAEPCAALQIAKLRGHAPATGPGPGLTWGRLPEVAIDDVRGGRIVERVHFADRTLALDALCDSLARVSRFAPFAPLDGVERASTLRFVRHALGIDAPRAEKRAWLARRAGMPALRSGRP